MTRRDELAAGLAAVEARIVRACAAAGRPREEVVLVAVSKTWPASDISLVHGLGVRDVAENKDQEAAAKAAELAPSLPDLCWHFVGQLQTNKARSVAAYADVVHSLDRARLARALSDGAERAGRQVDVLVQVALGSGAGRGGAAPDEVVPLAGLAAGLPGLRLAGLMAVAPLGADPAEAFAQLRRIGEQLRAEHPDARVLSAGMSGDLEQAVAAGATHLRVGTAVFGHRGPLLR